jgi:AraC-like DNA-binding protein
MRREPPQDRRVSVSIVACYREFAPHPALAHQVRALFSFTERAEPVPLGRLVTFEMRFAASDRYQSPLFADANASIVFDLGATVHGGVWLENAAACGGKVIGPLRRVPPDARGELPAMVGVYLRAAQLSAFAPMPTREVTDRIVSLEHFWGVEALELSERLVPAREAERLDLIERVLLRRMATSGNERTTIDIAGLASWIGERRGRVSIEALANGAGVSRQHLTRVFRERVGVSPKTFCRLARFQSALHYARVGDGVDWAGVACELGYTDQSHMIAEFREFSSLTPRNLATEPWFHPFIERAKSRKLATAGSLPAPDARRA